MRHESRDGVHLKNSKVESEQTPISGPLEQIAAVNSPDRADGNLPPATRQSGRSSRVGSANVPSSPEAPRPLQHSATLSACTTARSSFHTDEAKGQTKETRTQREGGRTISDRAEKQLLQGARRVLLLEFLSTGGGHTAGRLDPVRHAAQDGPRALDPLLAAANSKSPHRTLGFSEGVVLFAPPRWPHNKDGGKVNTLHDKADALRSLGVGVIRSTLMLFWPKKRWPTMIRETWPNRAGGSTSSTCPRSMPSPMTAPSASSGPRRSCSPREEGR